VLVLGETGVGKELVARELHRASGREGAFVPVNCAAIPEQLAESELFGHVAGAFTGAGARSDGLFVSADGGTLFLDEVGELPPVLQPKLLRALATGEVRAVGAAAARRVQVRVVAATWRDVVADTDGFRRDLLARLAGWTIPVPPLRDRRDDLLPLAAGVLAAQPGAPALSASAAEALLLHDWPRNVRELEQVVAAAAVRAGPAGVIGLEHLPEALATRVTARDAGDVAGPDAAASREAVPPLELLVDRTATPDEPTLRMVLERLDGNLVKVAELFGRDRKQIYRWLERYGLDAESFRKR
jgi:transcriptional regulator with GAF, ATPase, and Fis domain